MTTRHFLALPDFTPEELAHVDALLRSAHFRTALAMVGSTRELLATLPDEPDLSARRARLEVMAVLAIALLFALRFAFL